MPTALPHDRAPVAPNRGISAIGNTFAFLALVGPVLAIFAPLSLAPLLAVVAVAAILVIAFSQRRVPVVSRAAAFVLGALVVWAAVTLLWTLDPVRGSIGVGRIAFMFFAGLVLVRAGRDLDDAGRRRVGSALAAGTLVAVAVVGIDAYGNGPIVTAVRTAAGKPGGYEPWMLNRPVLGLLLFFWPFLVVIRRKLRILAFLAVSVPCLVALGGTQSTTAALAAAAGFAIAFVAAGDRRIAAVKWAVAVAVAVAVLGAPAYTLGVKAFSGQKIESSWMSSIGHRLYIWDFVAGRVQEKPLRGWGLESSPSIPGGHAPPGNPAPGASDTAKALQAYEAQLLPLHPHNAGLQIWLELGLPGALLFLAFLLIALRAAAHAHPDARLRATCLGQYVAIFIVAELAFGIWQSWWISGIALSAALTAAVLPGRESTATRGAAT